MEKPVTNTDKSTIQEAVVRLLRPLVRLLIRHSISHSEFAAMARRAYVTTAEEDFRLPGRKQSVSRISMLTGVQRKEVSRLRELAPEDPIDAQYNRAMRVISGWRHDPVFADANGQPATLPLQGPGNSFEALIRQYSGDLPYRAVLDELVRVGSVERTDEGVTLLREAFGPSADQQSKISIMGHAARDLLETIDHNLTVESDAPSRLQLSTAYDNLPPEAVEAFRDLVERQSQELLAEMDRWLAAHDRDATSPADPGASADTRRLRAGIGIYYFEEEIKP